MALPPKPDTSIVKRTNSYVVKQSPGINPNKSSSVVQGNTYGQGSTEATKSMQIRQQNIAYSA